MAIPLRVREAVEADGEAIGEAHAEAWLAAYSHIFEPNFLAAAAESRRVGWPHAIRGLLLPPNNLLVGLVAEGVVAFSHATPTTVSNRAEIAGFYCHPDAWGTGISAALMTRTKDRPKAGFNEVTLWTARDAARARRFYEKVGFQFTGNTRHDELTNWTSGAAAECPSVEYTTKLSR